MAMPTHRSSSKGANSGTAIVSVTLPATVVGGDLLKVDICNFHASLIAMASIPSGWKFTPRHVGLTGERVGVNVHSFYKIADGTEDGTVVDFTYASAPTPGFQWVAAAYADVDTDAPFGAGATRGDMTAATACPIPAITTVEDNNLLVAIVFADGAADWHAADALPANYTSRQEILNASFTGMILMDNVVSGVTAGVIGTVTYTAGVNVTGQTRICALRGVNASLVPVKRAAGDGSESSSATTRTVTPPAGVSPGDVFVWAVQVNNETATVVSSKFGTGAAALTLLGEVQMAGADTQTLRVYGKVLDDVDVAPGDFSAAAQPEIVISALSAIFSVYAFYTNAKLSQAWVDAISGGSGSAVVSVDPAPIAVVVDDVVLSLVWSEEATAPSGRPAGYTNIASNTNTPLGAGRLDLNAKAITVGPTEDPGAYTVTSNEWGYYTLVIQADSVAAGGAGKQQGSIAAASSAW